MKDDCFHAHVQFLMRLLYQLHGNVHPPKNVAYTKQENYTDNGNLEARRRCQVIALGPENEDYDVSGRALCVIFDLYFYVWVPGLDQFEYVHVHQVVVHKQQCYVVARDQFAAAAIDA
jgi:hypothetical protein